MRCPPLPSLALPSLVVTMLAAAGFAAAADGRTPIWQATTITEPGAYSLAHDLAGSGTLIEIAASGVDLDLAGHTLTGDGTNVAIHADGFDDLRIHDGSIALVTAGIEVRAGGGIHIERVVVRDAGDWGFRVDQCTAAVVRDGVVAPGNGRYGIYVYDSTLPVITSGRFDGSTSAAVQMASGSAARFADNEMACPGCINGIIIQADVVALSGNGVTGPVFAMEVPGRSRVEANLVEATSRGITTQPTDADDITFEDNIVRNGSYALEVRGLRNEVIGNLTASNVFGLVFSVGSANGLIRRNVSRNNTFDLSGAALCTTAGDNFVPNLY